MAENVTQLAAMAERVQEQVGRIFQAMGVISCAQHAAPSDVGVNEPDLRWGLRAAYGLLESVCSELDEVHDHLKENAGSRA